MEPFPQPMEHGKRVELANAITERLMKRYGELVKAIGVYGSLARDEDGPYSDIEMFCVLRVGGESRVYEWCAGPWKAEVDVLDEVSLRKEAARLDGSWACTHRAFVDVLPLMDQENYFSELKELVLSHPPTEFQAVIEEVLIGDIYELIGKVRNAYTRKHNQALPLLSVELAKRTAYASGLEHRHLYGTNSYLLSEAMMLSDPPQGFHFLADLVLRGDLSNALVLASACDSLWQGLVNWARERKYTLVASEEIPF